MLMISLARPLPIGAHHIRPQTTLDPGREFWRVTAARRLV